MSYWFFKGVNRRMAEPESAAQLLPARGRLRVTFVGYERFWMDVLVRAMRERYNDEIDARWMPWPSTFRERFRFMWMVAHPGLVVRVGMPFEFESETNRLWLLLLRVLPRLRGVNYWTGSDVMLYKERLAAGLVGRAEESAIRLMRHFAGSEHLREELAEVGVDARTVILLSPERDVPDLPPPFPKCFGVVAYLHEPQDRFDFYGGPAIFSAAEALPDASFAIVGSADSDAREAPDNVHYLGRVEDMDPVYEQSVVLVRMVRHDGVPSAMVEEAMVFGRHVVYSFIWPHTEFVAFGDEDGLIAVLRDLRDKFAAGTLGLNIAGREFTLQDWDPDRRSALIREALLEVAGCP
jgi:hypothetical protein